MLPAPIPDNEAQRLDTLLGFSVLDTPPEVDLDEVVTLASTICHTPIALVSLVDSDRQWFKAKYGLSAPQTPRDVSFCGHAIMSPELFVVEDARQDPRFADNPLVVDAPHVIFYAGAPLTAPNGHRIGTLCAIDHEPRALPESERQALEVLAKQVMRHMVLMRTNGELREAHRSLEAARNEALAASAAKSAFLANMSHEIRTPMTAVIGMAELLILDGEPGLQTERARTIMRSANALLELLNNILDYSKIEAGKMTLEAHPFHLAGLAEEACEMLAVNAACKDVELLCDVDPDVPEWVEGDSVRLRQVLINLIGNAAKFTEEGEVVVSLRRSGGTDARPEVEFAIRDTGVGITAEQRERIFDAFAQAETGTTRKFGGTGLGLTLCSKIVAAHGSEIAVHSEPGRGTTFSFTIPMDVAQAPVQSASEEVREAIRGRRVLVVDDRASAREVLGRTLQGLGAHAELCEDGACALACLEREAGSDEPFVAAFVDYRMPGMSGGELLREIRNSPHSAQLPVFVVSAIELSETRAELEAQGVTGCISKPVKRDALLEAFAGIVAPAPPEDEATAEVDLVSEDGTVPADEGFSVLLAEDNEINIAVAVGMLEHRGHSVTVARNGREAVDCYVSGSFDIVLMDVQMPVLNGMEATEEIRQLESELGRRTPIVALTAHAFDEDRERFLGVGMDDHVSKPLTSNSLLAAFDRLL